MRLLLVALAGAAGALARYGVAVIVASPWSTLAVNVAGAFAIGVVLTAGAARWSPAVVTAVAVGFLGAFTTFSTLAWDAVRLPRPAGAAYVAATLALGLLAVVAGRELGERLL